MNQTTIFSVLALDLQGSHDWDTWMKKCTDLEAGIHSLLRPLNLKSDIILRQVFDEKSRRFGITASLGPGKQRNFLSPLEHSIGARSEYRDLEARVAMDHVRSCLASVNRRPMISSSGSMSSTAASPHGIEMDSHQLTTICAKLAAKGEQAQVRDARGAVWTANVRTRHLRLASDEPMKLTALPTKVGNSSADFRVESLRVSSLKSRSSTLIGTWGPLFNPDWSDAFFSAMKRKQWLEITCAAVLHPSGFVKELRLYGFEEWARVQLASRA
ncbi:MAG: hypothetical protein Q8S92_04530 [Hydrogenophaga sp.]|uniref:hypothetical protein n=1 Tax=Hydrogenophaga sp. TaxID=1904254 RepID=UPI002734AE4C|nr:hypothetical protein [Hydrogenophaga sp.]MDP3348247.1 hypothetical protein [Hydrogenophaga sp.]